MVLVNDVSNPSSQHIGAMPRIGGDSEPRPSWKP